MLCGTTHPHLSGPPGGRLLWETPHPVWSTGPCRTVTDGPLRLTVAGNCYATDEQLHAALQAASGRHWRELARWPGSYWAVSTDGVVTAIVGDLAGVRPVYHTRSGGMLAWASRAAPLADLTGTGVDLEQMVAWLAGPTVPELLAEATVFPGVAQVPPGAVLELPSGAIRRWEQPATTTMEQAASELRQALTTAIGARAEAHPVLTTDLSGGVDSTTVAAIASHSGLGLTAFTHDLAGATNDDLDYAERAAVVLPGLAHHVVPTADRWFDGLEQVPATDLPYGDAARWAVHSGYLQAIAARGSCAHLMGGGGDTLFAPPAYALADLIRARRWRAALWQASARARLRHLPVAATVRATLACAATDHAAALRQLAHAILTSAPGYRRATAADRIVWLPTPGVAAWLTRQAAAYIAQQLMQAAEAAEPVPGTRQALHRAWCETTEYGAYHAQYEQATEAAGVRVHAPMLDNAVVRAALAIGVHERLSAAVQKPLLAQAMAGMVPGFVLTRPTKGSLGGAAHAGAIANREMLGDMVASSRLVADKLIDRHRVEADLTRLATGAPGRFAALELLISTELWLAQQETRRPTWSRQEMPCPH